MTFEKQKITRMVVTGGGARGAVYPGAYDAFLSTGVFSEVEHLVGASIGAITATFMAIGVTSPDLRTLLLSTNFMQLLGTKIGNWVKKNEAGVCFMTKDGAPILDFLRIQFLIVIRKFLEQLDNIPALREQYPDFAEFLTKSGEPNFKLTFRHLALLKKVFPDHFKKITIPALRYPDGALQIFNAEITPDVEVALACRASASLPVVLKPVPIEIDGKESLYFDPGIFDNAPTDYFDKLPESDFIKNQHPEQTLVLALGSGDKQCEIWQAMHGSCWDEVIDEAVLRDILDTTMLEYKKDGVTPADKLRSFIDTSRKVLTNRVAEKKMSMGESDVIFAAIQQSINDIALLKDNNEVKQVQFAKVLERLTPQLYHPSSVDWLMDKGILGKLSNFNLSFFPSTQYEKGVQKLRKEYALRTVDLTVGRITSLEFDVASKYARVFYALGYLDAMNYILNHDLYADSFIDVDCVKKIMDYFECIYEAILMEKCILTNDPLWKSIQAQKEKKDDFLFQRIYQVIKEVAIKHLDSPAASALAFAVEFHHDLLNAETLFEGIYEKGTPPPGLLDRMWGAAPASRPKMDLPALYKEKVYSKKQTLVDKIFSALIKMEKFCGFFEQEMVSELKSLSP